MFSEKVGMRSNSQKLLLVITDGKSNDPEEQFENVIPLANKLSITRFAIGVNLNYWKKYSTFLNSKYLLIIDPDDSPCVGLSQIGKEYSLPELELIASSPQFVFETESFSALTSILSRLREKIFSVEGTGNECSLRLLKNSNNKDCIMLSLSLSWGTDTGNFSSFQMELSQGGFSVALSEVSNISCHLNISY